jgi:hypothetical protein
MYSAQGIFQHHFQCKKVCTIINKIRYFGPLGVTDKKVFKILLPGMSSSPATPGSAATSSTSRPPSSSCPRGSLRPSKAEAKTSKITSPTLPGQLSLQLTSIDYNKRLVNTTWLGPMLQNFFVRNLRIFVMSKSVCLWQVLPA